MRRVPATGDRSRATRFRKSWDDDEWPAIAERTIGAARDAAYLTGAIASTRFSSTAS